MPEAWGTTRRADGGSSWLFDILVLASCALGGSSAGGSIGLLGVGCHRFGCDTLASSVSNGKYLSLGSPISDHQHAGSAQHRFVNTYRQLTGRFLESKSTCRTA
jgi:hypothetical protein